MSGRPPLRLRLASAVRAGFWRLAFRGFARGVTVTGKRPQGPCVVVANHGSHADTAALLAALGGASAPLVVAAADYWFADPVRALTCRTLIGAAPVRRTGGGSDDLRRVALPALAQGRAVVVFPEGTRSRDGRVAPFHSGAMRLAAEAGVPVLPVGLAGTRDVLPPSGDLTPAPVQVSIGAPLAADGVPVDAALVREQVVALAHGPAVETPSRWFRRLAALTDSRWGLLLLLVWGAAEAVCWPVLAEFSLLALVPAARPRRVPALVAALATGSVLGVVGAAVAARHGLTWPLPLTTPRMARTAAGQLAAEGPHALVHQFGNGIPVKVYARQAGAAGTPLPGLLGWTALVRGTRMAVVGAAVTLVARVVRRPQRGLYGSYLVLLAAAFGTGLSLVVASWR